MKIYIKWSKLTNEQRKQVTSFYHDEIAKKEITLHSLNQYSYRVNTGNGNVMFHKDF